MRVRASPMETEMKKLAKTMLDVALCGLIGCTAHIVRKFAVLVLTALYGLTVVTAKVYYHARAADEAESARLKDYGAWVYTRIARTGESK